MFENRKLIAYFALVAVGLMLWNAWQAEHLLKKVQVSTATEGLNNGVPSVQSRGHQISQPAKAPYHNTAEHALPLSELPKHRLVTIENDLVRLHVDTLGGTFVRAELKKYPAQQQAQQGLIPWVRKMLGRKDPNELADRPALVNILTDQKSRLYVAQHGMTGKQGPDTPEHLVVYQPTQMRAVMKPGQRVVSLQLRYHDQQNRQFTKTIRLQRGRYAVDVIQQVDNHSKKTWSGHSYAMLARKQPPSKGGLFNVPSYNGGSMYTPDKPYTKVNYSTMQKDPVDRTVKGGWLAMQQRYFLSAWIAPKQQQNHYYSSQLGNDSFALGVVSPEWTVKPGESRSNHLVFYVGPEDTQRLAALAPGLDLTIDYGVLWMISAAIFWIMQHIHGIVGNWGWSIVLVTLLIKLAFYYPSAASYRSMARMRALQPKIKELQKRYQDDKQKLGQATMELYRKEKANPLGGCLPMLIQIPFFIALYWVLIESVQLRQAPFIGWVHDLSVRDPYFILPLLMAISMFVQQKMQPEPPDPAQAKVMMFLPVVFGVIFASFPAGLVLYWLTNNVLSALQQWWVMRCETVKR
jgi:YidC/Oxa1 family membrane protein insertase